VKGLFWEIKGDKDLTGEGIRKKFNFQPIAQLRKNATKREMTLFIFKRGGGKGIGCSLY